MERRLSPKELLVVMLLALVPRLLGLGGASMWLDEALQTQQTRWGFANTWTALQGDVHPPLDALISSLVQELTTREVVRRWVPVAWGTLTVTLLALWVSGVWGRRAGWIVGIFASLSPFHVRYSQELRPYSLAILLGLLAFIAFDKLLESWTWLRLAAVATALSAAFMTLFLNVLLAIPLAVRWLSAYRLGSAARVTAVRVLRFAPLLLLGPALFLLAWWPGAGDLADRAVQEDVNRWSVAAAWSRWEFLTVGAIEEETGTLPSLLGAGLLLLGVRSALKTPGRGLAVIAAAGVGTVGVELLLLAGERWTAGRYNFLAWPYLMVLLALGALSAAEFATRVGRRLAAPVLVVLLVLQSALASQGLARYYREGREDWRRLAAVVSALGPEARPVLVANDWVHVLLSLYLEQQPSGAFHLENLQGRTRRLAQLAWSGRRSGRCASLVVGGRPPLRRLRKQVPNLTVLAEFPEAGASLLRIPAAPGAPACPPLTIPEEFREYAKRPILSGLPTP